MTMQIGERIIVGILAFITFASPLVSGQAAAGDIQPYRAQEITPYTGSDISLYQAEGIQPYGTEKVEEYRAQDVKPVQASTLEPVQGSGVRTGQLDNFGSGDILLPWRGNHAYIRPGRFTM